MILFNFVLISTFIITRILTYLLHDKNEYNSNTITGFIREKTKFEFHHIHIGILLLIGTLILNFLFQIPLVIFYILLPISLSLIADQIFPLLKFCCYFSKTSIIIAILLHLFILLTFNILYF